jgi:hypothetical protein
MTMKREAKQELTSRYAERLSGARPERSVSPRQLARYGRWLPADYAAKWLLGYERETKRITREGWAERRAAQRRRINGRAPGPHHIGDIERGMVRR